MFDPVEGDQLLVVQLNDKCDKRCNLAEIAGLFAHEASHVFDFICENMGEENPSSEFKAYAMQNIIIGLLMAYDKTRRDGKLFK